MFVFCSQGKKFQNKVVKVPTILTEQRVKDLVTTNDPKFFSALDAGS